MTLSGLVDQRSYERLQPVPPRFVGSGGCPGGSAPGIGARRMGLAGKRMATLANRGVAVSEATMIEAESQAGAPRMRMPGVASGSPQSYGASTSGMMLPPPPRQASTRAMAGALGLLGPLSGVESRDSWITPPSLRERAALDQLRASADFRLHNASGAAPAHLRTALGWLQRFMGVFPGRRLFLPYSSSADVESAAYNEETFRLLSEFIRSHGSVRPGHAGEAVLSCTISDYISAIRAFVSREAGYSLLVSGGNLRLPKQLLHMRREDGPAGSRELSRALTARLLRKLWRVPGFDYHSRRGILRWAVLWVGHNLLLRGGEFGAPDRKDFSSTAGVTLADVEWISPCAETGGYCVAVVDVLPIKNVEENRVRVPMIIRRRAAGSALMIGATPPEDGCAWTALRRLYDARAREVPSHLHGVAPLFAGPVTVVHTADALEFIREAAAAVGEDPALFNARALRIGGATDLYHLLGAEEAERTIQKRGRWCSECHQVYTRMSATAMCTVSARMADASGVDLEAFRSGYVMPAVVQRRRAPGR